MNLDTPIAFLTAYSSESDRTLCYIECKSPCIEELYDECGLK